MNAADETLLVVIRMLGEKDSLTPHARGVLINTEHRFRELLVENERLSEQYPAQVKYLLPALCAANDRLSAQLGAAREELMCLRSAQRFADEIAADNAAPPPLVWDDDPTRDEVVR